ncbi:MAG: VOC family protein [Terriglobales bacterium]
MSEQDLRGSMAKINARLAGVELYFDDLPAAKSFYREALGLALSDEQLGHHAQFDTGAAFLCLEKKGVEDYPSRDKAVIFIEVSSVQRAVEAIGRERFVHIESGAEGMRSPWAVLHDPEGHNVLLLEKPQSAR